MPKTLLFITASPMGDASVSNKLANGYVKRWQAANPDATVIRRDVGSNPPPHLDQATLGAFFTAPDERSAEQAEAAALSDTLVAELKDADEVVIAVPMHNFTISSGLKTWVDHVARAGQTFAYSEAGPKGLLRDRPVRIIASRGGNYDGSPLDFQLPYIRHILNFMGITSITAIAVEATAMGTDGVDKAEAQIKNLDLVA